MFPRCDLCGRLFWPWQSISRVNGGHDLVHTTCYLEDRFNDLSKEMSDLNLTLFHMKNCIDSLGACSNELYKKLDSDFKYLLDRHSYLVTKQDSDHAILIERLAHIVGTHDAHFKIIVEEIAKSDMELKKYMETNLIETGKVLTWLEMNGMRKDGAKYFSVMNHILVDMITKYTGMELEEIIKDITDKDVKKLLNEMKKKDKNSPKHVSDRV